MILENDRYVAHFNGENPFPQLFGCRILSASVDGARAELAIDPARHHNSAGIVHGGVYLSLADNVAACAANADGEVRLSTAGSYEFLAAAREGTLHAEAVLMKKTRRLVYYEVNIRDDAGTRLFHAVMQSFCVQPPAGAEQKG